MQVESGNGIVNGTVDARLAPRSSSSKKRVRVIARTAGEVRLHRAVSDCSALASHPFGHEFEIDTALDSAAVTSREWTS